MNGHLDNPYCTGLFAPVQEELTDHRLPVIGRIPDDLCGIYVRNGPNPRHAPPGRYHWYDGDGMLHALQLQNGQASYRNRWIRTKAFEQEAQAGKGLWSGLMEPVSANPSDMPYKDTANTDVIWHGGRLLALWYISGQPYAIDPINLETDGRVALGGKGCRVSAHSLVDPRSDELRFFDYQSKPPYLHYGVIDASGELRHRVPIDLPGPRLPHSLGITEDYSILMDLPVFPCPDALRKGKWRVRYHADVPARFGIIPRYGDNAMLRWFEAQPCYIYHVLNSWQEGDEVVLVAGRVVDPMPAARASDGVYATAMANLRLQARLHEWRFDLRSGQTRERALDDLNTEFPMINERLRGQRSRYAYNLSIECEDLLHFTGLVKYDLQLGTALPVPFGAGRFGSEAPFAPRIGAVAEDDGYLLSFIHDTRTDRSEVAIYDARMPTDGPVARVLLPQRVPLGFHATWVPGPMS